MSEVRKLPTVLQLPEYKIGASLYAVTMQRRLFKGLQVLNEAAASIVENIPDKIGESGKK